MTSPDRGDTEIPLSVVMPAYDEAGAIEAAVCDIQEHVLGLVAGAEAIVVNDGSSDETGPILDRLAARDPRLRVIHQANAGHGGALRTGLDAAWGTYVLLIDSDRQIPLDVFPALWEIGRECDGAFGVRVERHDPGIRLALTKVIRRAVAALFRIEIRDANVPFKIFRRQIWIDARPLIPPRTLAPSLFLAIFARYRRLDVVECPVPHRARATGTVSIRRFKLFRFCARASAELLAFRVRLR